MKRKHEQEEPTTKKTKTSITAPYLSDDSCWLITTFLDPVNIIRYCLPISKQWYRVVTDRSHLTACLVLSNTYSREGKGKDYTANYEEFIDVSYKSAFTKLGLFSIIPGTIIDFSVIRYFSRLESMHAIRCGFANGHLMPPTLARINLVKSRTEDIENLLSGPNNIRWIKISDSTLTERVFHLLLSMERLERIELIDVEMNITDLFIIAKSESLTHLTISGNNMTPSVISGICSIKNLTHLAIEKCPLCRREDYPIISNNNKLVSLSLSSTNLSDLGEISEMSQLTSLDISKNPIPDSSLQYLSKLKNLTHLNVSDCDFREHGSKAVCSMKSIIHLEAKNTHINGAIFNDLSHMKNLAHLSITSLISDESIRVIANRSGPKFPSLKSIKMYLLSGQDEDLLRRIVPIGPDSIERLIFAQKYNVYVPMHRKKEHPYIPKFVFLE